MFGRNDCGTSSAHSVAGSATGKITLQSSHPVALGMVLVVLSFALSLGYSHFLLRPIDEQALSIMENTIPSLQHLANVRVGLAHLGKSMRDLVDARGASRTRIDSAMETTRRRVESEFRLYRASPASPASSAEARGVAAIEQSLAGLERATDRVRSASGSAAARQSLLEHFEPALERTDSAAAMLQRANENHARVNASRILQVHHEATVMATLLGGASLALALLATLLVLRVLRTRAEITQEYLRLLTERSAELEAFAGRVAHDLRDPLSSIALQVSAATGPHRPESDLALRFEAIGRQLKQMNQVIDDLLEFARAGAAPDCEASANLTEVLNAVVTSLRPRLGTIPVELTVEPVPALEVACTPGALSSVLSNLIGNAAKFVVEGSELPRRIAVRVNEAASAAHFEIEDNGPGIPKEAQDRIFAPFQRLLATRQPRFGLGLATVKKIVEAYRGRVGVRSRPGKGSVFWFELPKARTKPGATSR
jgi:signal transduction histidine kinase